jgi:antitoxin (DNA-binding transcriptional repressor) of toxin-antitoxin stability system
MRYARSHLPFLMARAAKGEPIIITRAGQAAVKLVLAGRVFERRHAVSGSWPGRAKFLTTLTNLLSRKSPLSSEVASDRSR